MDLTSRGLLQSQRRLNEKKKERKKGKEKKEKRKVRGERGLAARRPQIQKQQVTRMSRLYREEQPSPRAGAFRGGVCQPGGPYNNR